MIIHTKGLVESPTADARSKVTCVMLPQLPEWFRYSIVLELGPVFRFGFEEVILKFRFTGSLM